MNKVLSLIFVLTLVATATQAVNLHKGFERKEVGISIKGAINTEIFFSIGYALHNKLELGVGYGVNSKDKNLTSIDSDLNFHFYPKKKFDLYLGTGLSYSKVRLIRFLSTDTLYENPTSYYSNNLCELIIIGMNYWFNNNISLCIESYSRFNNVSKKISNRPLLGIKFAF